MDRYLMAWHWHLVRIYSKYADQGLILEVRADIACEGSAAALWPLIAFHSKMTSECNDVGDSYPRCYPALADDQRSFFVISIISCFYWWAHKDSNLGPAD